MKDEPLFWQWAGYLSNPLRRTDIHAEMPQSKEREFRENYFELTREPILLPGNSAPFYVWKGDVNKYGAQLRVYFNGDAAAAPGPSGLFTVTSGRVQGSLRINKGDFVRHLFGIGFLLGKNADCAALVKPNVPSKFKADFDSGFKMMSPVEEMEMLVLEHCSQHGLTEKGATLQKLRAGHGKASPGLLDVLCKKGMLAKSKSQNVYTLVNVERLRGEIENKSIRSAIELESDGGKREVLLETYVRDRGWIRLAKSVFGDACMFDRCQNAFHKENGERYIETHHIKWLSDGGTDRISNLAMLCAHHHRMAHFAEHKVRQKLRAQLQQKNNDCLRHLGL